MERSSGCVVMMVVVLGLRARLRSTAAPTPTTSSPEARFSHGYRSSGRMNADSASATTPSSSTPAVWVTVTVAPSAAAWRAVPRVPTR